MLPSVREYTPSVKQMEFCRLPESKGCTGWRWNISAVKRDDETCFSVPAARLLRRLCFCCSKCNITNLECHLLSSRPATRWQILWLAGSGCTTWRERVVWNVGSSSCYMTAHCVAPQQSLMMATPDFVMNGLLGGVSNICLFGFGAS